MVVEIIFSFRLRSQISSNNSGTAWNCDKSKHSLSREHRPAHAGLHIYKDSRRKSNSLRQLARYGDADRRALAARSRGHELVNAFGTPGFAWPSRGESGLRGNS